MTTTNHDLETFITENQTHLETIHQSLNAFNIFNVLGVQHREIRHSNFLGWLFDPNDSHQLGDRFLKDLLKLIREIDLINAEIFIPLILRDLSKTRVARETENNIDLLIVNEELGFVICIENKINAEFSDGQLEKYYDYVEKNYSHLNTHIYLTLTPFSSTQHLDKDEGNRYTNITYRQILTIIKKQKPVIEAALPTVRESINQYITMVENSVTRSGKDVKLAQEIYRKHKREIDFIVKNQHRFKDYKQYIEKAFTNGEFGDFDVIKNQKHSYVLRFLPKEIKSMFFDKAFKSWEGDYFFCLELILKDEDISLKWGFGNIPSKDQKLQEKKTLYFNKMKAFKSMQPNGGLFKSNGMKPEQPYPGVGYVHFFNFDEYLKQEKDFMDFFKDQFNLVNEEIIQPWIIECKALNWE